MRPIRRLRPTTPPSWTRKRHAGPGSRSSPRFHGGIHGPWAQAGRTFSATTWPSTTGRSPRSTSTWARSWPPSSGSAVRDKTVVVLTSDHGESLGEHDYYFDHGEDLFDPSLRVPLFVIAPRAPQAARSRLLASTLDVVPTILDAVKVSYPPELAGQSLLPGGGRTADPGPPQARGPERPQPECDLGRALQAGRGAQGSRRAPLPLRPEGRSRGDPGRGEEPGRRLPRLPARDRALPGAGRSGMGAPARRVVGHPPATEVESRRRASD